MGAVARTLMTFELLLASGLLVLLIPLVLIKLNALCKDRSGDDACKRPTLNVLMIAGVVVGIMGVGLAGWKIATKTSDLADSVQQMS